jgi:hypothetical protein
MNHQHHWLSEHSPSHPFVVIRVKVADREATLRCMSVANGLNTEEILRFAQTPH